MNIKQKINKLIDKIPDKYVEVDRYSKYNPLKIGAIWVNTTRSLDNFYKRPEINLSDDKEGKFVKNEMRHIVGPAILSQNYPYPVANAILGTKEFLDYVIDRDINDNIQDFKNNQKGINFSKSNGRMFSKDEVMNYAYNQALKDYMHSNLYDSLNKDENLTQGTNTLYGHITKTEKPEKEEQSYLYNQLIRK